MKNYLRILPVLIILFLTVRVSGENDPSGGRSGGLGGASVMLFDIWSAQNNQAGLAFIEDITAGLHFENRFMVNELSRKTGIFAFPTKAGVFSATVINFGYSLYQENKFGLAFARSFGDKFSAGLQLDMMTYSIGEGYGNTSLITFEAGFLYKATEELTIGSHVFNPIQSQIADYNEEKLPTIIKLGVSYKLSDNAVALAEAEKDVIHTPVLRTGIEYMIFKETFVRIGYSNIPPAVEAEHITGSSAFAFGFGMRINDFVLDISSNYHEVLNFSTQASLSYAF